jgi:hypothetical protein
MAKNIQADSLPEVEVQASVDNLVQANAQEKETIEAKATDVSSAVSVVQHGNTTLVRW